MLCSVRKKKLTNTLIQFRYGNSQPNMAELSTITETLSKADSAINITWGMATDDSLGDSFKVVLVASVKA